MSESGSVIPITDAQAQLGTKALETLQDIGGFLREILGTVPEDLVGMLGGDWLKVRRRENIIRLIKKAHERLQNDGIKPEPASLSVSVPLLKAAADESREELQDLWAELLAATADPARSKSFRNEFITVIKSMAPIDAVVFKAAAGKRIDGGTRNALANNLQISGDALAVSLSHMVKLDLWIDAGAHIKPTSFSRELARELKIAISEK